MTVDFTTLTRRADFLASNKGLRVARPGFVLLAAPNGGRGKRLGITVTKRIGNAVVRNRWKRRLREAFRQVRGSLPSGNDFVIVVRSGEPPAGATGAREMETAIAALAARVVGRRGYADAVPRPRDDAAAKPKRRR